MSTPRYLLISVAGARGQRAQARAMSLLDSVPRIRDATVAIQVRSISEIVALLAANPEATPIAAGGDGTARVVAAGLLAGPQSTARAMAVLALGTGNALAHALGLAPAQRGVRALADGCVRRFDVMRTDRLDAPIALVSISAGIEADLIRRYTIARDRGSAPASRQALVLGVTAALGSIAAAPRTEMSLRVDGQQLIEAGRAAANAGLYNFPMYAGGLTVWPDADPCDGYAEAAVHFNRRAYFRSLLFQSSTARPSASGGYRCARWRSAELSTTGTFQMDGERVAGGTIRVRVDAGALALIVPLESAKST